MFLLWILVLIGIPLVLRLRTRVTTLEGEVARQQQLLQTLSEQLRRARRDGLTPEAEDKPEPAEPRPAPPVPRGRRLRCHRRLWRLRLCRRRPQLRNGRRSSRRATRRQHLPRPRDLQSHRLSRLCLRIRRRPTHRLRHHRVRRDVSRRRSHQRRRPRRPLPSTGRLSLA
jgi:hypothetical protein